TPAPRPVRLRPGPPFFEPQRDTDRHRSLAWVPSQSVAPLSLYASASIGVPLWFFLFPEGRPAGWPNRERALQERSNRFQGFSTTITGVGFFMLGLLPHFKDLKQAPRAPLRSLEPGLRAHSPFSQ